VNRYLLDVNVLLALSLPTHQHHLAATKWFDEADFEWVTTPITEAGYVRLMTNSRVVGYSITAAQAMEALRSMREALGHVFVPDATSLTDPAIDLGQLAGTKQVTDFHLLNLAALNSLKLATFDGSLFRTVTVADRGHVLVIDD
jgi:toxin-antitoxin system PIN domain toxin